MITANSVASFVLKCCAAWDIKPELLLGKGRSYQEVVAARKAMAWLLRQSPWCLSYPRIGRVLERDHTSVMHLVSTFDDAMQNGEGWVFELLDAVDAQGRDTIPAPPPDFAALEAIA